MRRFCHRVLLITGLVLLFAVPVAAHTAHSTGAAGEEARPYGAAWVGPITVAGLLVAGLWLRRGFVIEHFEELYIIGLCWFMGGALLDAYNHLRGGPAVFINLEHSIAYSGTMLTIGVMLIALYDGWRQDDIFASIPDGYRLALLSPLLFIAGGGGDMIWHRLFGFEVRPIQMLSPTHLLLAVGGLFIFTGPLRHAWVVGKERDWRDQFPMLLSAMLLLSGLTFMIQQFHPYVKPISAAWYTVPTGATEIAGLLGIAAITLNTILLVGLVLLLVDRFEVVQGGFTFIIGFNSVLMAALSAHLEFAVVGIVTGLVTDLLYHLYRQRPTPYTYRAMTAAIPFSTNTLYFTAIAVGGTIGWSVHVWTGVIGITIGVGLLMSYLVRPTYAGRFTDTPK